jgi:hypothetical protein
LGLSVVFTSTDSIPGTTAPTGALLGLDDLPPKMSLRFAARSFAFTFLT